MVYAYNESIECIHSITNTISVREETKMDGVIVTLVLLVFAIIMFVWEKIPLSITAMTVAVCLTLTGVLTPKEAFLGFVDSNVLLFMAMFIVGAAFFDTGVAHAVGGLINRFAKTERQLIIAVMCITGLMSTFLSNTGTTAVLIPLAMGLVQRTGIKATKLLMPLAIAASAGGNVSLIGSPGNMIAQSGLAQQNLAFAFFDYALVGLPVLLVGIAYFALIGHKLLPEEPTHTPATEYTTDADYSKVAMWRKVFAAGTLVATVLGMIFESQLGIKLHVIAWIGALFLVATRTISEKVAVNAIDMKTILLFVGSLALAQALVKIGAGAMIADTIIQSLGDNPSPFMLLAVVFCIAAILTQFMSNTATTALLVPISLALAQQVGADPKAVLMATVIGGSVAFATPIGCPPNTMVYNVAGYSFMDYVKVGGPYLILAMITSLILLPIFFPFYP